MDEGQQGRSDARAGADGRKVAGSVALGMGVPFALAVVLGGLRPDLVEPMFAHPFGYALTGVVWLLSLAATGLYLLASLARFERRAPRIAILLAGFLLCTLPALLVVLFGPIVFAFSFGSTGS